MGISYEHNTGNILSTAPGVDTGEEWLPGQ